MQAKIYNYLLFVGLSFAIIGLYARSGLGREKLGVGVVAARMPSLRLAKSGGMLVRGGNVLPGVTGLFSLIGFNDSKLNVLVGVPVMGFSFVAVFFTACACVTV